MGGENGMQTTEQNEGGEESGLVLCVETQIDRERV